MNLICGKSHLVPEVWDIFEDDWEKVKDHCKKRFGQKLKKKEREKNKEADNGNPSEKGNPQKKPFGMYTSPLEGNCRDRRKGEVL